MGSNVAFSLDQLSNLVKQNEYLVKGLSKWFYSDDDYVVFSNKNNKTIDGLLEYDAKADDRIIFDEIIDFTGDVAVASAIDYLVVNYETIDTNNSYKCEYKIKLDDIDFYNSLSVYDVINLSDDVDTVYDFVVTEKLGNKVITVFCDYYFNNTTSIDSSTFTTIELSNNKEINTNSKLIYNVDEFITLNLRNSDLILVGSNEYYVDYFYSDDKSIVVLKNFPNADITGEQEIIIYYGDNNVLSPKLIYKDLIHFPTLNVFSKFKNSNYPLLSLGSAGELLLNGSSLLDCKINGYDTDDFFKIFVKSTLTIFDKNSTKGYHNLPNGYYRVYIRTNILNDINSFSFDLDIVLAPVNENYENKKYIQIGGIYLVNNVITSVFDLNNKPNISFDEIEDIIKNYNTYPVQTNNFWYINKTQVDLTQIETKTSFLIEKFRLANFNEAKTLVDTIGDIYIGAEYIDGVKYYCVVSKLGDEPAIYKYSPDTTYLIEKINVLCIV